jgi:hypothetical protein
MPTDIEHRAASIFLLKPPHPVDAPRRDVLRATAGAAAAQWMQENSNIVQQRGVVLDPPPDGRVIDHDAAFRHYLLKLAVADGVFAVPAHALEDDEAWKRRSLKAFIPGFPGQIVGCPPYLNPVPVARQCNSAARLP